MVNRLLLLNGVAVVNVILFHATGFGFWALFFAVHRYRPVTSPNFDQIGSTAYYVLRLTEQYIAFTIPAFLFVSGFFVSVLAGRSRSGITREVVMARIRALAVPYLLWSTLILTALALEGRIYPLARYVRMILTGSVNPTYYYVPLLMQLYLLAPAIVWSARRNWRTLLAVTAVLQIGVYVLQYPVLLEMDLGLLSQLGRALPKWLFIVHLFWFTLGVVIGLQQQALKPVIHRFRWHLVAAAVGLFVVGCVEWEWILVRSGSPWVENRVTLVDGLYAGSVILAFIGFQGVGMPFSAVLMDLAGKSFGIYLIHGVVMDYTARSVYHFAPWVLGRQPLFLTIVMVMGLGVPLALMALVKRSRARGLYPYFFG